MPTTKLPSLTTAAELFRFVGDGYHYELIAGELRMMSPAGGRHGRVAIQIAYLLKQHVAERQLGVIYAAETGFLIDTNPDTVLAPDVAFLRRSRHEGLEDEIQFVPLAPDLVVEVVSPNERFTRVEAKAFTWLEHGTGLVLLVDPESQRVHAYRSTKSIQIFESHETIDCSDVVDGWTFPVVEVFRIY